MSIFSEINRIKTAKDAIKQSIVAKGVAVDENAKLNAFPSLIDNIQTGVEEIKDTYTVTFIDFDHVITEYELEENDTIVYPEPPQHPELGINFKRWTINISKPGDLTGDYSLIQDKKYICIGAVYDNEGVIAKVLPPNEGYVNYYNNTIPESGYDRIDVDNKVMYFDNTNEEYILKFSSKVIDFRWFDFKVKYIILPDNSNCYNTDFSYDENSNMSEYCVFYLEFFIVPQYTNCSTYGGKYVYCKYYANDIYKDANGNCNITSYKRATTLANPKNKNTSFKNISIKQYYNKDNKIKINKLNISNIDASNDIDGICTYDLANIYSDRLKVFWSSDKTLEKNIFHIGLIRNNYMIKDFYVNSVCDFNYMRSNNDSLMSRNFIFASLDNIFISEKGNISFDKGKYLYKLENLDLSNLNRVANYFISNISNYKFLKHIIIPAKLYNDYENATGWTAWVSKFIPNILEDEFFTIYNIIKNDGNYQLEYNDSTLSKTSEVKKINENSTCEFISEQNDYYDTIFEGWFDKDDNLISSNKVVEISGNSYDVKKITAKYHVDIPTESKWVDTGETTEVDGVVYHKLVDPSTLNVILVETSIFLPSSYKDSSAWAEYTNLHIDNYKIYQEIKKNTGSTFNWMKVDFTEDCDIYWQSSGEQNYDYLVCTSSEPTSPGYNTNVIFNGKNKNITTDFSDTTWETYHVDHTVTPTLYFWMKRDGGGYVYQDSCLVALPSVKKTAKYNEKYVDDNGNELVANDNATA